jgi:hypothetical protein
MRRHAARNGQTSSDTVTTTMVVTKTSDEVTSVKPAPGPM